jgi:hypothetical protein
VGALPIVICCAAPPIGQRRLAVGSVRLKMAASMPPSAAAATTPLATRFSAMRVSVRPPAVRSATMNAISTKLHSTTSSAKPRLSRLEGGGRARGGRTRTRCLTDNSPIFIAPRKSNAAE